MEMTFRWYGESDRVPLAHIRQIPGVEGVVSALYDVAVGDAWPGASLEKLAESIDAAGLRFAVVESIPVHEDIKLGRPSRDRFLDQYCDSVRAMGELGIPVLCYNFMPIFDWTRTTLDMPMPDGSTALAYDDRQLARALSRYSTIGYDQGRRRVDIGVRGPGDRRLPACRSRCRNRRRVNRWWNRDAG